MAYIGAQDVKAIRDALKARFPEFKFGCKKGAGGLSVDVTIKQGPVDFFENYLENDRSSGNNEQAREMRSMQVNHYWLRDAYSGRALEVLEEVVNIIKTAPARGWYDNSDAMTDYFDTAYYFHINIGSWDKPYALVK
jgi:hypothetical protein